MSRKGVDREGVKREMGGARRSWNEGNIAKGMAYWSFVNCSDLVVLVCFVLVNCLEYSLQDELPQTDEGGVKREIGGLGAMHSDCDGESARGLD